MSRCQRKGEMTRSHLSTPPSCNDLLLSKNWFYRTERFLLGVIAMVSLRMHQLRSAHFHHFPSISSIAGWPTMGSRWLNSNQLRLSAFGPQLGFFAVCFGATPFGINVFTIGFLRSLLFHDSKEPISNEISYCTGWPSAVKLVGGLEHVLFFHILGIIIPVDFHIFQRGWNLKPPTSTIRLGLVRSTNSTQWDCSASNTVSQSGGIPFSHHKNIRIPNSV